IPCAAPVTTARRPASENAPQPSVTGRQPRRFDRASRGRAPEDEPPVVVRKIVVADEDLLDDRRAAPQAATERARDHVARPRAHRRSLRTRVHAPEPHIQQPAAPSGPASGRHSGCTRSGPPPSRGGRAPRSPEGARRRSPPARLAVPVEAAGARQTASHHPDAEPGGRRAGHARRAAGTNVGRLAAPERTVAASPLARRRWWSPKNRASSATSGRPVMSAWRTSRAPAVASPTRSRYGVATA